MSAQEDRRPAFEIWAKAQGLNISLNWNNNYSHVTLVAWQAWNKAMDSIVILGEVVVTGQPAEKDYIPEFAANLQNAEVLK